MGVAVDLHTGFSLFPFPFFLFPFCYFAFVPHSALTSTEVPGCNGLEITDNSNNPFHLDGLHSTLGFERDASCRWAKP